MEPALAKQMREGFWRMLQRIHHGIPGFKGSGFVQDSGLQFNGGLAGMNTAWPLKPHGTRLFEAVPIAGFYLMGTYWPKILREIGVFQGKRDNFSRVVERLEKEFGFASIKSLTVGTEPIPKKSRRKKLAGPELGRLDTPSVVRYIRHVLDQISGLTGIADRFWADAIRRREEYPELDTYHTMGALSYMYGPALAREMVTPLLLTAGQGDVDAVIQDAGETAQMLHMIAKEVHNRMQAFDPAVILKAYEEIGGSAPIQFDINEQLEKAMASYGGRAVYFNDFHWNVISTLMDVNGLLEKMLIEHGVPEDVIFHREGSFDFFVPESILRLNPQDRRILMEDAIRDINRAAEHLVDYGPRQVRLPDNPFVSVIFWENGSKHWFLDYRITDMALQLIREGAGSIPLDSNYLLVEYPTFIVHGIMGELEAHPLYALSLQARERGEEVEPTDVNVIKIVRRLVNRARPYAGDSEKESLERDLIRLLARAKHENDLAAAAEFDAFTKTIPGPIVGYLRVIGQWLDAA